MVLVKGFAFGIHSDAVIATQGGPSEPAGGVQLLFELVQPPDQVSLCILVLGDGNRESADFVDRVDTCRQVLALATEGAGRELMSASA
ncbi:hypothetical protein E4N62_12685 [Streptomyces sp. MNU76]|uniref:hypothetical protein n=1 Tax=Streptomyces sp. MNU76 TaxID=2560026 RepID=UPI001E31D927|nr:hypothetical protein [Streptomyces sp. MNU76]MCC9706038.1 hypothetical protein [Streptomyces sp. MNU76]